MFTATAVKLLQSVTGKSVIITGGGSGLGEATALFLAEKGAKVTILDFNTRGKEVAAAIGGRFVKTDVTIEADVLNAIHVSTEAFGPLFAAINCAGVGGAHKVINKTGPHPLDKFENIIKVNLIGTFNVCRLAAQAIAARKATEIEIKEEEDCGVIINTASVAAFEGQIGQAAYSASKGGIVGLTIPLARDLASHRIRVNTICPGIMGTPMLMGLAQPARESLERIVPHPHRLGNPMEFAALVHHIMENGYINGECIRLDGAMRMQPR